MDRHILSVRLFRRFLNSLLDLTPWWQARKPLGQCSKFFRRFCSFFCSEMFGLNRDGPTQTGVKGNSLCSDVWFNLKVASCDWAETVASPFSVKELQSPRNAILRVAFTAVIPSSRKEAPFSSTVTGESFEAREIDASLVFLWLHPWIFKRWNLHSVYVEQRALFPLWRRFLSCLLDPISSRTTARGPSLTTLGRWCWVLQIPQETGRRTHASNVTMLLSTRDVALDCESFEDEKVNSSWIESSELMYCALGEVDSLKERSVVLGAAHSSRRAAVVLATVGDATSSGIDNALHGSIISQHLASLRRTYWWWRGQVEVKKWRTRLLLMLSEITVWLGVLVLVWNSHVNLETENLWRNSTLLKLVMEFLLVLEFHFRKKGLTLHALL